MVTLQTLLPFVTVVILVVVELSRQSSQLDLEELVQAKEEPFVGRIPNLGFVTIVHSLNVFLLMVAYFVILLETGWDSLSRNLVLLAVVGLLFLIPYLEIKEYDLLLNREGVFNSRDIHILLSLCILIEPILLGYLSLELNELELAVVGTLILSGVYATGVYYFLKHLREEFDSESWRAMIRDY